MSSTIMYIGVVVIGFILYVAVAYPLILVSAWLGALAITLLTLGMAFAFAYIQKQS